MKRFTKGTDDNMARESNMDEGQQDAPVSSGERGTAIENLEDGKLIVTTDEDANGKSATVHYKGTKDDEAVKIEAVLPESIATYEHASSGDELHFSFKTSGSGEGSVRLYVEDANEDGTVTRRNLAATAFEV